MTQQVFISPFGGGRGRPGGRLLIAAVIAIVSIVGYLASRSVNPVTHQTQHIAMTPQQEIALGLQSVPQMVAQYGGESQDPNAQRLVNTVGQRIVSHSPAAQTPYQYQFHVLADDDTINAFALPGGQVFITSGLLHRLHTEGQLAGTLAHEVGHVVARHSAEHLAKARLTQGLTGAAAIASYDPNNPNSRYSAAAAAMIGQLVNLRFGRQDELQADNLGVQFMADAGYDPRAMIGLMEVLDQASQGRSRPPEFFSTHPNPENREARLQQQIAQAYPNGVPAGLQP